MKISYQIRLMPEFAGKNISSETKCYEIVKTEYDDMDGTIDVKESIEKENLTKVEANNEVFELDQNATLLY